MSSWMGRLAWRVRNQLNPPFVVVGTAVQSFNATPVPQFLRYYGSTVEEQYFRHRARHVVALAWHRGTVTIRRDGRRYEDLDVYVPELSRYGEHVELIRQHAPITIAFNDALQVESSFDDESVDLDNYGTRTR